MPLIRSSDQKSKTLEEFYSELIESQKNMIQQNTGKAMLSFISLVNQLFINTILYGTTSHDILLIQATDNWEDGWFVAIYAYEDATIQIEYKMSKMKSPWQDAIVKGQTNSIEEAVNYLIIAMMECEGWKDNNELNILYTKLKNQKHMTTNTLDSGPFYHGTKADLRIGDLLTAGFASNYKPEIIMNHIYFTALPNGAGLAAALAKGDAPQRVYIVEPTGNFENDPNVTDKKFPGNPTRSYRSAEPLKVIGELTDWVRQTPEEIARWKETLAKNTGEIIN